MSFLITSHGRSGTAFLAKNLRCAHEGEWETKKNVSSLLRERVNEEGPPKGYKLGVILRHPLNIYLSACCEKWKGDRFNRFLKGFEIIDQICKKYAPEVIYFDHMVRDPYYLRAVMFSFGVSEPVDLSKTNEKPQKTPPDETHIFEINTRLRDYIERYSL